jgi:TANK-binding kinase 1
LLAGLLEENQKRMWNFERFFWEVTNILSKKVIHIFYMNRASSIEIFMDPDEPLFHFKEHVNLQSDVNPDSQLLLYDEEHLEDKVGANTASRGYPPTTILKPIMLLSVENNNVSLPKEFDLPKFPTFPAGVSVENDASLAKVASSVGHECKRRIENFSRIDTLIQSGIERLVGLLRTTLDKLSEKSKSLDEVSAVVHELAETLELLAGGNEIYSEETKQIIQDLSALKEDFARVSEPIQQLYHRFVTEDQLTREWKTSSREIKNPSKNYANEKSKHLVERLRESWQHLLRDRATRSLTYNDEQFHALEKVFKNIFP